MRYWSFWPWGIQIGPFQPARLILFQNVSTLLPFILGGPISYYPREKKEGRSRGWKWGKGITKSEWDTGVSDLGAFKLDHLQPVRLIFFQNVSTFLPFILGGPISYYRREKKEGAGAENGENGITQKWMKHRAFWPWGSQIGPFETWKWGKRNHPKVNETQGFLILEHSNWTICSLLGWFSSKIVSPFYRSYWEVQFLITPERGSKEGAGAENGEKRITQMWMKHSGFWPWGIQIGPFAAC